MHFSVAFNAVFSFASNFFAFGDAQQKQQQQQRKAHKEPTKEFNRTKGSRYYSAKISL
jgi:hypothetical protein